MGFVVYLIDNAVVPLPDAIEVRVADFLAPSRAGLAGEIPDAFHNPSEKMIRNPIKIAFRAAGKLDRVRGGHRRLEAAFFLEVLEDGFHRAARFPAAPADGFEVDRVLAEGFADSFVDQRRDALVRHRRLHLEGAVKPLFEIDRAAAGLVALRHRNSIITS